MGRDNFINSQLTSILKPNQAHFLYSINQIEENARRLKPICKKLYFSVKSNPNIHLVKRISNWVDGFDISSELEMDLLKAINVSPEKITLSGPAKSRKLIQEALHWGVHQIHLDSIEEYKIFIEEAPLYERKNLSLRLQIDGDTWKKLGMKVEDVNSVISDLKEFKCNGLHAYLGREQFSSSRIKTLVKAVDLIRSRNANKFTDDFTLYLGAGLPSASLVTDENLTQLSHFSKYPLHLETGRYLVNSAGWYCTQVLTVKIRNKSDSFVIVNGGLQHLAATLISPNYGNAGVNVHFLGNSPEGFAPRAHAAIYGSLGMWNDRILPQIPIPAGLKRGDWILLNPCGAYGYTAGANQFIAPNPIRELLFEETNGTLLWTDISSRSLRSYLRGFEL